MVDVANIPVREKNDITVSEFEITTTNSSEVSASLYANGRMQTQVRIDITAVKPDGSNYDLDDSDLKLVFHDRDNQELSGDWKYDIEENEFNHVVRGESKDIINKETRVSTQTFIRWVRTTDVENCRIAAKVTVDGKHYYSNDSSFNNIITLTGIQPENFSYGEMGFDKKHMIGEIRTAPETRDAPGEAYNYYLSLPYGIEIKYYNKLNDLPTIFGEPNGVFAQNVGISTGSQKDGGTAFIIDMGPEFINDYRCERWTVNDRPGEVTACVHYEKKDKIQDDEEEDLTAKIELVDEYGNSHKVGLEGYNDFEELTLTSV